MLRKRALEILLSRISSIIFSNFWGEKEKRTASVAVLLEKVFLFMG